MNKTRYETMLPGELENIVKDRPLAWLPIGTLEWHGRHLPVGLDALKAHALCLRVAEKAGGAVLPANYFSTGGMMFPWTFKYPAARVARNVFDTLRHLNKQGFKAAFVITGHYPLHQILMLMAVAETFMAARDTAVIAVPEFAAAMSSGYLGDHAAKWETSIMMELHPELVDETELARISGIRGFSLMRHGVHGQNPADHASRETGAAIVEEMIQNFTALADEILEQDGKAAARRFHRRSVDDYISRRLKTLPW